jgi:hypothetical protein
VSDTIYDGDLDRLTFYGTTDLDARRRALRFQAENLDYVLAAVCFASGQSGLSQERSITVKVCTHRYADSANITSVRCGLVERAAKLLELPYSEYVQALGAVNDSIAEARLKVIQNERHRSVAAMKGATCCATGWARDSKHGYEGANAEVWLKAWDYCDSAMRQEASNDDAERMSRASRAREDGDALPGYVLNDEVLNYDVPSGLLEAVQTAFGYHALAPMYHNGVSLRDALRAAVRWWESQATDDATKDDCANRLPPTVHLTLARMTATGSVDCHDIMGNRQLGPGSYGVLRDVARLAGWKYACVNRPGEPRQTLLWVEGGSK